MTQNITAIPARQVELWTSHCGAASATALAVRNDWLQAEFAQGGTHFRHLRDATTQDVRDAHYHHGQSGLFREGGNIPAIWARARGAATAVVGITWVDEYQGILTRADSNIACVTDLARKRLGVPLHANALIDFQRGAARHGFSAAFASAGLDPEQARFVHIQATAGNNEEQLVRALDSGYVDAIYVRFARGQRLGRNPRFHELINLNTLPDPLARVGNGTPRPITVDRAFLERHPDIVARYLAVLVRTANWAAAHPYDVAVQLAQQQGVEPAEALAAHGPEVHLAFTPSLSAQCIAGLEKQKNFLHEARFLAGDFDLAGWIDPGPLAAAHCLVAAQPALTEFPSQQAA